MIYSSVTRALVKFIIIALPLVFVPGLAQSADPVREVRVTTGSTYIAATSIVNLKYTRVTDGTLLCQTYYLIEPPNAVATMILFVGGAGQIGIADGGGSWSSSNFNLRTRWLWAAAGPFNVVLIDAPFEGLASVSDPCSGVPADLRPLDASFRRSVRHQEDIETVIADLRAHVSSLPIILNGTSRGTISAANAAANISGANAPAGLILTSAVTRSSVDTALSVNLEDIKVPTFLGAHKDDACDVTPPEGIETMKERIKTHGTRVQSRIFSGGKTFEYLTTDCSALAPHGFFGMEPEVVKFISDWIR